jgi:metal-responsive CopG/Arc/MetJ family transcriptional regulator
LPNTRVNITLPTHMVDDIKDFYGARGVSRFIEEAVEDKLSELKKKTFRRLIEGYRARTDETVEVLKKFEVAVTEKRNV